MKEKEIYKCPHCGSIDVQRRGKTRIGTQRYYCKTCKKRSAGNRTRFMFQNKNNIKCPICGGIDLALKGKNPSGTQIYLCHNCNKKFTANPIRKPLTIKDKQLIIMYHLNLGVSITDISKHIHRSFDTVNKYIKQYKERNIIC